jgi:DNA-binding NtrC family response regulator
VCPDGERAGDDIVGRAPEVRALRDEIRRVAPTDATVLIEGETGTGKELVAAALHSHSVRRDGPFVAINCAAIPENLVESELFGHDKGAFTGAMQAHAGQVEMAEGGTLLLDEVNELPKGLQAKLLRLLQAGEYRRLGGSETRRADVRIVAATSKGLKQLVADGKFQNALFYRLYVIPLQVPALRDRRDDIPVLAEHFASRFAARYGKSIRFAPGALSALQAYGFPGNVRELENLIHRLVVRCEDGWIRAQDLPAEVSSRGQTRVSWARHPSPSCSRPSRAISRSSSNATRGSNGRWPGRSGPWSNASWASAAGT